MAPAEWLLLFEKMGSSYYQMLLQTHEEIKELGFTREAILGNLNIRPGACRLWMFIDSRNMLIPLHNDDSVLVTYELYAKKESVVTIIARPLDNPPPDHVQTPSAVNSLRARQELTDMYSLRNVPIEPRHPCMPKDMDPELLEPIDRIHCDNKLNIDLEGVPRAYPAAQVLAWVRAEAHRGVELDRIKIITMTMSVEAPLQLSRSIWINSLFRGPNQSEFREIWNADPQVLAQRTEFLENLYERFPDVENNMRVFIHDLTTFDSPDSRYRLSLLDSKFFIGEPYVCDRAAKSILDIPIDGERLGACIHHLLVRWDSETFCPCHLASLLLRAFGWTWEENEERLDNHVDLLLREDEQW